MTAAGLAAALERATSAWSERVWDPPVSATTPDAQRCKARITQFIHEGLNWPKWEKPAGTWWSEYQGDLNFSWCGAFVAWCLAAAGLAELPRRKSLASTIRLHTWAKTDKRRFVLPSAMRAGDVAVVGRAKNPVDGDHITLVLARDGDLFTTVEGNGVGVFPDGSIGQGVVVNIRPLSDVVLAYRPLPSDYATASPPGP